MTVKLSPHRRLLARALAALRPHLPASVRPPPHPPAATHPPAPHALPVLASLPALRSLAADATRTLADAAIAAAPELCWRQTYDGRDVAPTFLDRYGWAELLGPYGLFASDRSRLGFLLLGPDTLYPPHAHAAEELYLVLAGTADWQKGDEPWRAVPPGGTIHHPTRLPHAMRTAGEPLLAMYLWWGDELTVHARMVPPHG